jgi:hypothetical protein
MMAQTPSPHIVFYVTDSATQLPTQQLTRSIANELGAIFTSLSPAEPSGSVADLASEATVVVAHVTHGSPNLFYEIGLAHGFGKPVVLLVDDASSLPYDLRAFKAITLPSSLDDSSERQLRFNLTQTLEALINNQFAWFGYAQSSRARLPQRRQQSLRTQQLEWARGTALDHWFRAAARAVEGWELVEADDATRAYDLVIWNHTTDPELALLGNPIPVELRSTPPAAKEIETVAQRAIDQGLKGVILVSRKGAPSIAYKSTVDAFRKHSITIVILDSRNLERIGSADDLVQAIKERLRAFRSA